MQAILAGLVVGGCLGAVSCLSAGEKRAVSVADCVAQLALTLPDRAIPREPLQLTQEDLLLAAAILDGVQTCRRAHPMAPDGGT